MKPGFHAAHLHQYVQRTPQRYANFPGLVLCIKDIDSLAAYTTTMQTIVDLREMPGFNPEVTNGADSVSRGHVRLYPYRNVVSEKAHWKLGVDEATFITETRVLDSLTPYCHRHGAMNKVSADGIWRCLQIGCDSGCYQTK